MKKETVTSGNLKDHLLADILRALHGQKKTGILRLEKDNIEKNIYFEQGEIVFAASSQHEDNLGEQLVQASKITPQQLEESLTLSKRSGKLHGSALLALGYIVPKDLFLELKNQFTGIVCSLFLWEKGRFLFEEHEPFTELIKLRLDTEPLIQEASMRKENREHEELLSVRNEVEEELKKADSSNCYEILGLDYKASSADVRESYLKKVQKYHPDKYRHLSDLSLESKLTELFEFITTAYNTLGNEKERSRYDKGLLQKSSIKTQQKDRDGTAKLFRLGIIEYNKGNFWGASDYFRWVTRTDPDSATNWYHLSLALSRIPRRKKEAEESILKAIELEAHNANYYVHLGSIYLQAGLKKRAEKQFATALTWDPTNAKAEKELQKLSPKRKKSGR